MAKLDPHSYNDETQPVVQDFHWQANLDFKARRIEAEVTLNLARPGQGPLDLDTRDLEILHVADGSGMLPFTLSPPDAILGSRLRIELTRATSQVKIRYKTSPDASALQWLSPEQTAGGQHPFLFSQCQAIHARSVVPIQDTPRIRVRFTAEVTVPAPLRSLMAAAFESRTEADGRITETWRMPQAIPPYLFAFAVGDLTSRDLGPRSRVWAEPSMVDKAAWEFSQVDAMLGAGERLFGAYDWERFDILLMPPSFPYGGMENPRLTFLTPTLLAGDRSLVNVVAHELAHSWTGNLVSNANANHFWLNEGFTVYAERRILEALEGTDTAHMHWALGFRSLEQTLDRLATRPELTRLKTDLDGIDPDDAYSVVPYEKGSLFLRQLEEHVGREKFDRFLRSYLERFRFSSITTEDFVETLEAQLPGALAAVKGEAWLVQPGLPKGAASPRSSRLEAIFNLGGRVVPSQDMAAAWTPTEWQLYLEAMPRPADHAVCRELDERFHLSDSRNDEVLVSFLTLATESGYEPVLPRVEEVLGRVGRMKFLKPLFLALTKKEETRSKARAWFDKYQAAYHPIARQVVGNLLNKPEVAVP
ncbi:MAG TPA: M1 family metallopeptidase [Candidatus Xenobia bacterium]|jgi:leukotriene A-4 hydrolase/aminopeptidase